MRERGQARTLDPQAIYDVIFNLVHAVGLKLELKMDTGAGYGSDHGYKLTVTRTYGAMTPTEQALLAATSSMLAPPTQLKLPEGQMPLPGDDQRIHPATLSEEEPRQAQALVESAVFEQQGANLRATVDQEAAAAARSARLPVEV